MASVFISYSTVTTAAAERLLAWLRAQGFTDIFIDRESLVAGADWQRDLIRQLRRSDVVVLLWSRAAQEQSRWVFLETTLAQALGIPVLPLVIDSTSLPPSLAMVQAILVDTEADALPSDAQLTRLRIALARLGLPRREAFPRHPDRPPYPGLTHFDVDDAEVFFGRDELARAVIGRLRQLVLRDADDAVPWLVLQGASGAGKSSLLRAGITARLLLGPDEWLVLGPFRPRDGRVDARATAELAEVLQTSEDQAWAVWAERRRTGAGPHLVLVVDPLEEALRTADFAVPAGVDVVLGAVRADQWDRVRDLLDTPPVQLVDVPLLSGSRLRDVIRGPADLAGIEIEDELVDALVDEGPSALPLIAFALRGLFDDAAGGPLTLSTYRSRPDLHVKTALSTRASSVAKVHAVASERGLRPLLLGLVQLQITATGEPVPVRKRLRASAVDEASAAFFDGLVSEHVLRASDDEEGPYWEVSHESLLSLWEPLREVVTEETEFLRWYLHFTTQPDDVVLAGPSLVRATSYLDSHAPSFTPQQRARVNDAERRRRRAELRSRLLQAVVVAGVTALVAGVVGAVARVGQARLVVEQARSSIDRDQALQAVMDESPYLTKLEEQGAMLEIGLPEARVGHARPVTHLEVPYDGGSLVVGSALGQVQILHWDGTLQRSHHDHVSPIVGLDVADDGRHVVSWDRSRIVVLWDSELGTRRELSRTGKRAYLSPTGPHVAVQEPDTWMVYDLDGIRLGSLPLGQIRVSDPWGPDGSLAAVVGKTLHVATPEPWQVSGPVDVPLGADLWWTVEGQLMVRSPVGFAGVGPTLHTTLLDRDGQALWSGFAPTWELGTWATPMRCHDGTLLRWQASTQDWTPTTVKPCANLRQLTGFRDGVWMAELQTDSGLSTYRTVVPWREAPIRARAWSVLKDGRVVVSGNGIVARLDDGGGLQELTRGGTWDDRLVRSNGEHVVGLMSDGDVYLYQPSGEHGSMVEPFGHHLWVSDDVLEYADPKQRVVWRAGSTDLDGRVPATHVDPDGALVWGADVEILPQGTIVPLNGVPVRFDLSPSGNYAMVDDRWIEWPSQRLVREIGVGTSWAGWAPEHDRLLVTNGEEIQLWTATDVAIRIPVRPSHGEASVSPTGGAVVVSPHFDPSVPPAFELWTDDGATRHLEGLFHEWFPDGTLHVLEDPLQLTYVRVHLDGTVDRPGCESPLALSRDSTLACPNGSGVGLWRSGDSPVPEPTLGAAAWSPDGSRVVAVRQSPLVELQHGRLTVHHTDSRHTDHSPTGQFSPHVSWDPTGRYFLATRLDKPLERRGDTASTLDVVLFDRDGRTLAQITTCHGATDVSPGMVSWSPSGVRFAVNTAGGGVEIYAVDLDTLRAVARRDAARDSLRLPPSCAP